MTLDLKGRTALVTGAITGIGGWIAGPPASPLDRTINGTAIPVDGAMLRIS